MFHFLVIILPGTYAHWLGRPNAILVTPTFPSLAWVAFPFTSLVSTGSMCRCVSVNMCVCVCVCLCVDVVSM